MVVVVVIVGRFDILPTTLSFFRLLLFVAYFGMKKTVVINIQHSS